MIDIALDTLTGDIVYGRGPLGATIALVASGPSVVQRVRIQLQTTLGEWFMDQSHGMPWFESVLVKNPDFNLIATMVRRQVLSVEGVSKITTLRFNYDPRARRLEISLEIETDAGRFPVDVSLVPVRRVG